MARSIWTSVVKEVEQTTAYPGYRYIYFRDDDDANAYFTEQFGEDWFQLPWAQFMLGLGDEEQADRVRKSRHGPVLKPTNDGLIGIDGKSKVTDNIYVEKINFDYMIRNAIRQGIRNLDDVYAIVVTSLGDSNVKLPSRDHVRARVNKYIREEGSKRNKFKASAIKDAVRGLLKTYTNHYKIKYELEAIGINISRQRVTKIIQDIKQETASEVRESV